MKRQLPHIGGTALAVIVAVGVAGASAGLAAVSQLGDEERRDTTAKVLALKPGEVRRVSVETTAQTVSLTRTGDGEWDAGPGTPGASATLMFTFQDRLFPLSAYRTVPEAEDEFGLDDPEIILTVTDGDGDARKIAFGAETFTGGGHYVRPVDGSLVYLVPIRTMNDLRSLVAGKQIDRENSLPAKIAELDRKAKERTEEGETGPWLQQSLDAGTPLPEGLE